MTELVTDIQQATSTPHELVTKLKTAYDYLNRLSFTINGTCSKNIELLVGDSVCLVGHPRMINLILTKIGVHTLLPKKYGGFSRNSNVFILDAGNCTDVYQFVDFMKRYGLDVKKSLGKIIVSRVFTVYQLTHFLKYELFNTIQKHKTNVVIIPDLLEMLVQEPEINIKEVEFMLREIANVLQEGPSKYKILLITSISVSQEKLSDEILSIRNMVLHLFNKYIIVDMNRTNDKFKVLIREKQGVDYVTIKKYLSLSFEDVLTVIRK